VIDIHGGEIEHLKYKGVAGVITARRVKTLCTKEDEDNAAHNSHEGADADGDQRRRVQGDQAEVQ
jgi:hypothetical protein